MKIYMRMFKLLSCLAIALSLFPKLILAETNNDLAQYQYQQYSIEDKRGRDYLTEMSGSIEETNKLFEKHIELIEAITDSTDDIGYSYSIYSSEDEFVINNLSQLSQNENMPNAKHYLELMTRPSYKKVVVTKHYAHQFDIPQSIYYHEEGYEGYLPLNYVENDKTNTPYQAVFSGMALKSGPNAK